MTDTFLQAAFDEVCDTAVKPEGGFYVSLYVSMPFYGGPEEGGWWGSDTELVAYQHCPTQEEAERKAEAVQEMAKKLSDEAAQRFYEQCAREIEWVEQHDPMADASDYFPEPDGEERFWVAVEDVAGSCARRGERQYS